MCKEIKKVVKVTQWKPVDAESKVSRPFSHGLLQCDVLQGGEWIMTQDRAYASKHARLKESSWKDEWV